MDNDNASKEFLMTSKLESYHNYDQTQASYIRGNYTQQSNTNVEEQTKEKNLLLAFATPLLTLVSQIKYTSKHENVEKLKAQVIDEIKYFEQQLVKASCSQRQIIAARYCLCTAIDEAVLSKHWGNQSTWAQQSLLSLFHKETWGGERFYIILEEMAKEPRQHIDFLEFAYSLLSLGFEGKFYGNNIAIREEIRNRIFYRIHSSKKKPEQKLSRKIFDIDLEKTLKKKNRKIQNICMLAMITIFIVGVYYNLIAYNQAISLVHELDSIAKISPITTFSQVISRPIIE